MDIMDRKKSLFLDMLQVAFIVLKITRQVDWSWVWVFAPIWIPTAITLVLKIINTLLGRAVRRRM